MPLLTPLQNIISALEKEGTIPDVLPEPFTPSQIVHVFWPDSSASSQLGNTLTKTQTVGEPRVALPGAEEGAKYTVVLTDPDARSRENPIFREFRHWVQPGFQQPTSPAEGAAADLSALTATPTKPPLTPYRPPGPGPGTGVHRYVFLVFREPKEGYTVPPDALEWGAELEQRRSWTAVKFAERYGLELVGANYFLVEAEAA